MLCHFSIVGVDVVTKDKLLWMILMRVVKFMMNVIRVGIPLHHITCSLHLICSSMIFPTLERYRACVCDKTAAQCFARYTYNSKMKGNCTN